MISEFNEIINDLKLRYPNLQNKSIGEVFVIYSFMQTWPTTALGFSGCGGDMLTQARTYVFVPHNSKNMSIVYFNNKFAYFANNNENFNKDLAKHNMASVDNYFKYLGE